MVKRHDSSSSSYPRRQFLQQGALGVAGLALSGSWPEASIGTAEVPPAKRTRIAKAEIGAAIRIPNSNGDVWTTTWADDDNLYSAADDSTGFNKACNSNLAVQQLTGGPPPRLHGVTVNAMTEYGKGGELQKDGAAWKASGLTCIEEVLYLAISRHYYDGVGLDSNDSAHHFWIQETWDASIIKSLDHGETWSAAPALEHSMFPGRIFSNPFFVQYSKNGAGSADEAERYVYAVSNDGTWNNGNSMVMGRVLKQRISRLDPSDWEFIHGFDDSWKPLWRPRHDNALYIFRSPGRTSMTGIHYIAPLNLYIMPQWHYPILDDPKRRWKATRWEFYSAPLPWGPWTLFHTQDFEPQGFYNPCIPSKFISADGRKCWIFAAGDFLSYQDPNGAYGLNVFPLTLEVETV